MIILVHTYTYNWKQFPASFKKHLKYLYVMVSVTTGGNVLCARGSFKLRVILFILVAIGWSLNASKVRTFGFGTSWMVIVHWSNGTEDIRLIWQTGHVRQLGSMSGALGNIWGLSFIISPSFSLSLWYWAAALAKEFNVKKLSVSYTI